MEKKEKGKRKGKEGKTLIIILRKDHKSEEETQPGE